MLHDTISYYVMLYVCIHIYIYMHTHTGTSNDMLHLSHGRMACQRLFQETLVVLCSAVMNRKPSIDFLNMQIYSYVYII